MLTVVISSAETMWFGFIKSLSLLFLKELDLTNPKTFRNLAKPMGAQTEDRLAQYKKRYKDWEDPNGKYK